MNHLKYSIYNFVNLTKNAFTNKALYIIDFIRMFESRKVSF
jgi:hypothetical protein